jgi:hypothetical protein
MWGKEPRGNQEIIDRMNSIGLTECLYHHSGKLVPTFKNAKGGKIIHQMDHVYVSEKLLKTMKNSYIEDSLQVFEQSISDHYPIITEFEMPEIS